MARKKELPQQGWWGTRWRNYMHDVLEAGPRTSQSERGARSAPTELRIVPGEITAQVEVGNYGNYQAVSFKLKPLTERQWQKVMDAAARRSEVAQRLLNGNPGADLEALMGDLDLPLFPDPTRAVPLRCSCRGDSCRHINALVLHTADLLDASPFLWLEMRGISRAVLQAGIRARLADTAPGAGGGQPVSAERFWSTETDPDQIAVKPGIAALPDGLLRRLGPVPVPEEMRAVALISRQGWQTRPVEEVLRRLVSRMGKQAAALGQGEQAPAYHPWPTPGKEIPAGARLAGEVAEAVRAEGRLLTLEELVERCPTAAAVPHPHAVGLLAGALVHLPADLVPLGDRYVGPREAVLQGAAFSHVITFGEWHRGALTADADWARALALAGVEPPFRFRLGGREATAEEVWSALRPAVGDELRLTVIDPAAPVLEVALVRRAERSLMERDRATLPAAQALAHQMRETGGRTLTEAGALGLLLARGLLQPGKSVDPTWLLPFHTHGLSHGGTDRTLTWISYWRPGFGRGQFYGRDEGALFELEARLAERGESPQRIQEALYLVRRWWQYAGAEDQSRAPLASLLEYLWVSGPLDGGRGVEQLPQTLGDWFRVMVERKPSLREALAGHIAACSLTEAYAYRLQTLPPPTAKERQKSWEIEGYRWIGPEHFFAESPRARRW